MFPLKYPVLFSPVENSHFSFKVQIICQLCIQAVHNHLHFFLLPLSLCIPTYLYLSINYIIKCKGDRQQAMHVSHTSYMKPVMFWLVDACSVLYQTFRKVLQIIGLILYLSLSWWCEMKDSDCVFYDPHISRDWCNAWI